MNYVEPIRDRTKLNDILNFVKQSGFYGERNYIMMLMGFYSGLRISDILKMHVRDVKGQKHIRIREKKTGKFRCIEINPVLKSALEVFVKDLDPDDYLIKSRKTYNKSITRQQAWNIIKDACEPFGIYNVGTHTLRKTFGYHYYQKYEDLAMLMVIFNHSSQSETLRYIGITQDTINITMSRMRL